MSLLWSYFLFSKKTYTRPPWLELKTAIIVFCAAQNERAGKKSVVQKPKAWFLVGKSFLAINLRSVQLPPPTPKLSK